MSTTEYDPPQIPTNGSAKPWPGETAMSGVLGGHNPAKVFTEPGDDAIELLMRTVFKDEKQATAAILLYSKCKKYGFQRGIDDLRALCAARCSIQGRSSAMALQALTGVVAPGYLEGESKGIFQKGRTNKPKRFKEDAQVNE